MLLDMNRFCRHANGQSFTGYIRYHDSAGTDGDILANGYFGDNFAPNAQEASGPNRDIASQAALRGNMDSFADATIVIDAGAGIDDGQVVNNSICIHNGSGHYRDAV